jgi:adenylate cyclase
MFAVNSKIFDEVNNVLSRISHVLNLERSTLFLVNKKTENLESLIAQGLKNIIISIPIGEGIAGHCFQTKHFIIENDVQNSKYFNNSYDKQLQFKSVKILCVPVINDKMESIGVIECLNKNSGIFTKEDVSILESFSHAISLIIKNRELYIASEHIKNNFSTLLGVFEVISSELDLKNLIQLILSKASLITKSERSSLFFLDHQTGELRSAFAKGLDGLVVKTKKGIVSNVAKNKKSSIVNDPYNDPHFDSSVDKTTGYKTKSILSVPVFDSNKKVLGVVQAINKIDEEFTSIDLEILTGFANQIRIAIENAKLFDQLQGMRNHLNTLVQNLDTGILTIDKSLKITTVNQKFTKMFGLENSQDFVNTEVNELNSDFKVLVSLSRHTIKTGEKSYSENLKIKMNTELPVMVNLSVIPMQNSEGKVFGAIAVFNDITKEKRIQSNLSRYIPEHLVSQVMSKDDLSLLKGNFSKCSILFSDIRNFTSLTEKFGAIQIVELLNDYFEAMVASVHKHNGILDKYIGDSMMTVFGVPFANNSDARNAISCALDMLEILSNFNKNAKDAKTLNIGIGISTGNVVSGNIGSEKRFEYTVIGNSVNLAARLESATKIYNIEILICEDTFKEVKDHFYCREIDTILVKGMQKPAKVYTVIGHKNECLSSNQILFNKEYARGLALFSKSSFKLALLSFKKAFFLIPNDGPTQFFLKNCNKELRAEKV